MFKSVTKWFGVESVDMPEESETPDNAVGNAESDLEGKRNSGSLTAAATKESPTTETDPTKRDGGKNDGQSESPAPTSTDLNTSQESVLEEDDTFQVLEEASAVAFDTAKQVGSMLFSFGRTAGSTLVEQASKLKQAVQERKLLGDFYVEQEKLTNEQQEQKKKEEDAVAPWVGYHEHEAMKQQILSLSTERKTFLKEPPSDASYVFDFTTAYPVALATLKEDDNLQKMRFELVPKKVSEEAFWRNYFYCVSVIKKSVQLSTLQQLQTANDDESPVSATAAGGQTTTEGKAEETGNTKEAPPLTSTRKTPTTSQSPSGEGAHVQHDTVQKQQQQQQQQQQQEDGDALETTKRVDTIQPEALVATASSKEDEEDEEEEEEDEEDVDDEEWERVLQQEVDEFLKVEGYEDDSTTTTTTTKADCQDPDDEDPELLDLVQQIEQEQVQKAAPS